MNLNKIELTRKLNEICECLYWAQEDLKLLEYFAADELDQDKNYLKNALSFFTYSRKVYGRNIILELHKLFSPHEEFNIRSLLNELGSSQKYEGIVQPGTLKNWKNRIKDSNAVISKVILQRNQAIAHKAQEFITDREKFGNNNGISIPEAKELVSIVQEIAKGIYFALYNVNSSLDEPIGEPIKSLEWIINELVLYKKMKDTDI